MQVGRKFAEGYQIVPVVHENGEERDYSEVQFTPQFWFSGDLKWLSELAGDLGAGSNYPSSILKNVHASIFSYADSLMVRGGQGDDSFPFPQWLKGLYEEVFSQTFFPKTDD